MKIFFVGQIWFRQDYYQRQMQFTEGKLLDTHINKHSLWFVGMFRDKSERETALDTWLHTLGQENPK